MGYLGNTPENQAFTPRVDFFSGNASATAFTLSFPVASVAQVQATIENVPQNPGDAYTVSGNTITFTSAPPSGTNNIYVYYTSPITQVVTPGQGTVGLSQLTATGTPSASNYLRGDNSWATIASSQWVTSGSNIYYNTGSVGIGTATPNDKLDVNGTDAFIRVDRSNGEPGINFKYNGSASNQGLIAVTSGGAMYFTAGGLTERGRFDASGNFLFNSGYGSVATAYGCRAWVNFNGTGTVAIRASGNVSSVTDLNTGSYMVNFTNAMPDANYSVSMATSRAVSWLDGGQEFYSPTTTNVRFSNVENNISTDTPYFTVSIFR
jgi:hypothetical protein